MDEVLNLDWREQLYDRKAAELLLYGRALGLGESEAEDVLQETFVALLKLEKRPDNPPFQPLFTGPGLVFWHPIRFHCTSSGIPLIP